MATVKMHERRKKETDEMAHLARIAFCTASTPFMSPLGKGYVASTSGAKTSSRRRQSFVSSATQYVAITFLIAKISEGFTACWDMLAGFDARFEATSVRLMLRGLEMG